MPERHAITHISFIDHSPTSIMTAILDSKIPCDALIVLTTSKFRTEAGAIAHLAKNYRVDVTIQTIPENEDIAALKLRLSELIQSLKQTDSTIFFNVTCGSKIQSMSAYDVAISNQASAYLIDPSTDTLHWLAPSSRSSITLQDKLSLTQYFAIHDCFLKNYQHSSLVEEHKEIIGWKWTQTARELASGLAKLNYLSHASSAPNFLSPRLNQSMEEDDSFQMILDDLQSHGIVELRESRVCFLTAENRFFCNGGWLEEYVFSVLQDLKSRYSFIQDIAHSAEISRHYQDKTIQNELDVTALVNNKLHIIECKTKKYKQQSANDTLYKIDSLIDLLGGIHGRAALVNFYPITPSEALRARELDIAVFGPTELPNLSSHLEKWIQQA